MTFPLKSALSKVFEGPARTLGQLEELGAVSAPRAWYRLHLVNEFVDPPKEKWTTYYKMTERNARVWQGNATKPGGSWLALLEKFVNEEGWVEI